MNIHQKNGAIFVLISLLAFLCGLLIDTEEKTSYSAINSMSTSGEDREEPTTVRGSGVQEMSKFKVLVQQNSWHGTVVSKASGKNLIITAQSSITQQTYFFTLLSVPRARYNLDSRPYARDPKPTIQLLDLILQDGVKFKIASSKPLPLICNVAAIFVYLEDEIYGL